MRSQAEEGIQIDLEDDTPMSCGRLSGSFGASPHVHGSHVRTFREGCSSFIISTKEREGPTQEVAFVSDFHSNQQQRVGCVGGGFAWCIVKCHPRAPRSSHDDLHVDRHAILLADDQYDLPVTWSSSSGQVRALHAEEGRSTSLVDSIRATHVDSGSDRERVHMTQFDMTTGDTYSQIGPEASRVAFGTRPVGDVEPGQPRHGWQKVATELVHGHHITSAVWPWLSVSEKALFRSQGGPLVGILFTCFPTSSQAVFRVLLLRRLWQPLPPSSRFCRCGLLDPLGPGSLRSSRSVGRRAFALETARVCREAGARVTTNVMVRDLDLVPQERVDGRRLEVVADGLPLFHGAQLAVDTTMVAPLKRDGTLQPGTVDVDGAVLGRGRRRKERVYTELTGRHGRARLLVLACETGGRWSPETQCFLRQAAKAKTRHEPPPLRTSARLVWLLRWSTMLACNGARALALSLMEVRTVVGHDGPTPSTAEVVGEARYAGFV